MSAPHKKDEEFAAPLRQPPRRGTYARDMSGLRGEPATGVRYVLVGVAATAVSLAVFNVLVHGWGTSGAVMHGSPEVAVVIANTVGMLVSFPAVRSWVFAGHEGRGLLGQVLAFVAVNYATMAVPVLCVTFSRQVLGLHDAVSDNVAANVVGLALGNLARYVFYRQWLFPDVPPAPRYAKEPARFRLPADPERTASN